MDYIEFFSQLFILTFGIFAGIVLAFRIVWPKLENYFLKLNAINANRAYTKETMQLRFAAYERLLLLVHRIQPMQAMLRYKDQVSTAQQLRLLVIEDVENEFQHNIAQQLYVTDSSWSAVRELKESTVTLFRKAGAGLSPDASAQDFFVAIVKHMEDIDKDPYTDVQLLLKGDLRVWDMS